MQRCRKWSHVAPCDAYLVRGAESESMEHPQWSGGRRGIPRRFADD
jgi:hypothetical protein